MSHVPFSSVRARTFASLLVLVAAGCGDDDSSAPTDAGPPDTGPAVPRSTAHCTYEPMPANANATGTVAPGTLMAGAAEEPIDLPVGSALGAYTARADFLGSVGTVDNRYAEISGSFNTSVGIETRIMAKVVVLTADTETVVIAKLDIGAADDNITHALAERLGPAFRGKVVFTTNHSHSAWGHFQSNVALGVGFGRFRKTTFDRIVETLARVAERALAARRPARIGIVHDGDFDPDDLVTHDRRGDNDDLPNGRNRKDRDLFVVRVDATDGAPIALLPVFGVHGTVLDADNNLASSDAPGAVERALEEAFDERVVVVHLQGAAGDVSPSGSGGIDCGDADSCYDFARVETVGRYARDMILDEWTRAGTMMQDTIALEMLTRSVELGPSWENFRVRGGALEYAPWNGFTRADRMIYGPGGEILSPIDEFNAPNGAALCGEPHEALFPRGQIPGSNGLLPYRSCVRVEEAAEILGLLIDLPFDPEGDGHDDDQPVCGATRTTVSALRLGAYVLATIPGEPVTLFADAVRAHSPVAPENTIVVGYSQGHVGYVLTAEDWLKGGYEPSINFWGPLEGELIAEKVEALMALAVTDAREDGAAGGATRWAADTTTPDTIPGPDPAPMAGTVPPMVPELVFARYARPTSAQPAATVRRLESARFVWIGEDPMTATPTVTLEREQTAGMADFAPVTRRSGRPVQDGDLLLMWTPDPLLREGTAPRTHYWVAEWQAVTPWGTEGLDDVEDRPGVAVGRYRFHVEGTGYTLDSEPFDVVPGALSVTASRTGTTIAIDAGYDAPEGWRLLTLSGDSNHRVPIARGPLRVELGLAGGGTRTFTDVAVSAGAASVDAGTDAASVTTVRVFDRFDNAGSAAL